MLIYIETKYVNLLDRNKEKVKNKEKVLQLDYI